MTLTTFIGVIFHNNLSLLKRLGGPDIFQSPCIVFLELPWNHSVEFLTVTWVCTFRARVTCRIGKIISTLGYELMLNMLQARYPSATFKKIIKILRLNASPIPVQIVESSRSPSSYAVLKKFHGPAW